ncbi:MAG: hypothetical protein QOD86_188 [Miltoncostaeaceae bacterium]|nr:hypothetical protein [Miltoncostaeaceae bacterium]
MQALASRRGATVVLAVAAVALVVLIGFLAEQLGGRATVNPLSPASGGAVAAAAPTVVFSLGGADTVRQLRVSLDGKDRTKRITRSGSRVSLRAGRLGEGVHTVEVTLESTNPFSGTVEKRWQFAVDRTPPKLAVARPATGTISRRHAVLFRGTAEPGAEVRVEFRGGEATAAAGEDGAWRVETRLPEGDVAAEITAVDRAGNATKTSRRLRVDTIPPRLDVSRPARGEVLTATNAPTIYGSIPGEDLGPVLFTATVNGERVQRMRGSSAIAGVEGESVDPSSGPLRIDGERFALSVGYLPQGRNRIAIAARDAAGNVRRRSLTVLVDSTDRFGEDDMRLGARGPDAKELQRRLRELGALTGRLTPVLDRRTAAGLRDFQKDRRLPVSGVVDEPTRHALLGRLVVNIGQRKLRLIRAGKVVRTYEVAVGMPGHPTPTGTYAIVKMEVDPTWSPPDSPWAEGLGPIPPGPGNPLGTRWIGTSSPAIGIHGTYDDASIGTAASHGCIRMHIPDVEKLYDQVALGMEVRFVA